MRMQGFCGDAGATPARAETRGRRRDEGRVRACGCGHAFAAVSLAVQGRLSFQPALFPYCAVQCILVLTSKPIV
jgi:hypothetical protein